MKLQKLDCYKVLIVDDHEMVLDALSLLIDQCEKFKVCGQAKSSEEAFSVIVKEDPDVAIIDLSLQGENGLDLIESIRKKGHDLPILVLSMHDELVFAEKTFNAGAQGYIMKQETKGKLLVALEKVATEGCYLGDRLAKNFVRNMNSGSKEKDSMSIKQLTKREFDIFHLIGQGFTKKEIAKKLYISVKTVDVHKENIRSKLNLKNTNSLIQYAAKWEFHEPLI